MLPSASPFSSESDRATLAPSFSTASAAERTPAMWCHVLSFSGYFLPVIGNVLVPLVLWLAMKEDKPFFDRHGREVVNFQLSLMLWYLISMVLCVIFIGFVLLPALAILHIICGIIGAVRASDGLPYRYPLTIRFL
jgi:uncharacterized protein